MATGGADLNACTWWPDRIADVDWSACCLAHDAAYKEIGSRLAADFELGRCVAETTGWNGLALLMFIGVALFGWAFKKKRRQT